MWRGKNRLGISEQQDLELVRTKEKRVWVLSFLFLEGKVSRSGQVGSEEGGAQELALW